MKPSLIFALLTADLAVCSFSGQAADGTDHFYLHLDVGAAFASDVTLKGVTINPVPTPTAKSSFDPGIRGDLVLGYGFNDSWSVELESGVAWNPLGSVNFNGFTSHAYDGDLYQIPILLNVRCQFTPKATFSPYLGAGVGGVFTKLDTVASTQFPIPSFPRVHDTDLAFACQAVAGLIFRFASHWEADVEYKFLGTFGHSWDLPRSVSAQSRNVYTHAALASLNWKF